MSPRIGSGDGSYGHPRFARVENEQRIGQTTRAIKKLLEHYLVTAPSAAEPTAFAYFANTPVA